MGRSSNRAEADVPIDPEPPGHQWRITIRINRIAARKFIQVVIAYTSHPRLWVGQNRIFWGWPCTLGLACYFFSIGGGK
jgi:hypothetical protein